MCDTAAGFICRQILIGYKNISGSQVALRPASGRETALFPSGQRFHTFSEISLANGENEKLFWLFFSLSLTVCSLFKIEP